MKKFRYLSIILQLAFILGALTHLTNHDQVSAYSFTGAKWTLSAGQSVSYVVSNTLSTDLNDADCLAAVQLGYQVWTDISCSYMSWNYGGRTSNTAWGVGDGENVVSWRDSGWDDAAEALAITSSIFNFQGLSDADIKFNGVHHTWALISEGTGSAAGVDVASVSAHEVGHALGLDHSDIANSTMWPATGPGDDSARSLAQDDIDAICELYPSGGEVPVAPEDPAPPSVCLLYTSPSPRDRTRSRMPSSA